MIAFTVYYSNKTLFYLYFFLTVPPYPPYQISSRLVAQPTKTSTGVDTGRDGFYTLNITWVEGNNGGSVILRNQVRQVNFKFRTKDQHTMVFLLIYMMRFQEM